MHRFRFANRLMWVLCLAFLATRLGGAHLHLCLDGLEAPATVHVEDHTGQHHGEEAGPTHNDLDVPIATDALVKKSGGTWHLDLLPLLALWLLLPLAGRPMRMRPADPRRAAPASLPPHFLPLALAPPR